MQIGKNFSFNHAKLVHRGQALFEKINRNGKTIIVATHHKGIIEKMKKRTVKLRGGKIEADEGKRKVKVEVKEKEENLRESTTRNSFNTNGLTDGIILSVNCGDNY